METVRVGAQSVAAFSHLISPNVEDEIKKSINRHPDDPVIGDGFLIYGAYDEDLMIAMGALVIQVAGTVVMIRSLFVDPSVRKRGIAYMLVNELIYDVLGADDLEGIELLAMTESPEQMEVAEYLHNMGFVCEDAEESCYSTILSRILENGRLAKAPEKGAIPLKEVSEKALRSLGNKLDGDEDTFIPIPINREDYDQDVSMVVMKDDEVTDIVFIQKSRRGLIVSYVLSRGNGISVMTAIAAAMRAAAQKYRPDMPVKIPVVTPEGKKLVEQIVSDAYENRYIRCYYSMLPLYRSVYGEE